MGWEKICPKLKDLISLQAAMADPVTGSITGVPSASWILVSVDFNKCSAPSFSVSISQVGQEREREVERKAWNQG